MGTVFREGGASGFIASAVPGMNAAATNITAKKSAIGFDDLAAFIER